METVTLPTPYLREHCLNLPTKLKKEQPSARWQSILCITDLIAWLWKDHFMFDTCIPPCCRHPWRWHHSRLSRWEGNPRRLHCWIHTEKIKVVNHLQPPDSLTLISYHYDHNISVTVLQIYQRWKNRHLASKTTHHDNNTNMININDFMMTVTVSSCMMTKPKRMEVLPTRFHHLATSTTLLKRGEVGERL